MNVKPLARVREQARIQVEGEDRDKLLYELIEPDPGGTRPRPRRPPRAVARSTSSSTSRPTPGCTTTAWSTCSASRGGPRDGGHDYRADLGPRPGRREGRVRGVHRPRDRAPGPRSRDARLPLRRATRRARSSGSCSATRPARTRSTGSCAARCSSTCTRSSARASARRSSRTRSRRSRSSTWPPARGPSPRPASASSPTRRWLRDHDDQHLRDLADYNRDDCVSTLLLRDWLEGLRREGILAHGWDIPRPEPPSAELPEALTARQAATRALEDALKADVPADPAARTPEQAGRWLLAGLLDWHRRDAKSAVVGVLPPPRAVRRGPPRRERGPGRPRVRRAGRPGQEVDHPSLPLPAGPGHEDPRRRRRLGGPRHGRVARRGRGPRPARRHDRHPARSDEGGAAPPQPASSPGRS